MNKSKRPAHQNIFTFKHNVNSRTTKKIAEEPLDILCRRCYAKLSWRKKYRKYKQKTVPGKCNFCHEKNIIKAYRTICDPCALARTICAKCTKEPICLDPEELMKAIENPVSSDDDEHKEEETKKTDN